MYTSDQLLRTTVFLGRAARGKTNVATLMFRHLLVARPDVPQVVLDGGEQLSQQLWDAHCYRLEDLLADADRSPADRERYEAARQRVVYMVVDSDGGTTSGVSIDIGKLLPGERVQSRVSSLLGLLAHQRADSGDFSIVHDIGACAFAVLVAAGRPLSEMRLLFGLDNRVYWAKLQAAVVTSGHLRRERKYLSDALRRLNDVFSLRNESLRSSFTDSTNRLYRWLTVDLASLFERGTLDLHTHLDRGGVLLVRFREKNAREEALLKRALFGLVADYVLRRSPREAPRPILLTLDEHTGLDPATYVGYLARARNFKHHFYFLFQSGNQIGPQGDHYATLLGAARRLVFMCAENQAQAEDMAILSEIARLEGCWVPTVQLSIGESEDEGGSATETETITDGTQEQEGEPGGDEPVSEERRVTRETPDGPSTELVRVEGTRQLAESEPRLAASHAVSATTAKGTSWKHGRSVAVMLGRERISLSEQEREVAAHMRRLPVGVGLVVDEDGPPLLVEFVEAVDLSTAVEGLRAFAWQVHDEDAAAREAGRPPEIEPLVPETLAILRPPNVTPPSIPTPAAMMTRRTTSAQPPSTPPEEQPTGTVVNGAVATPLVVPPPAALKTTTPKTTTRVALRTFVDPRTAQDDPVTYVLTLAAETRFLTIANVVTLTPAWGYDKAWRACEAALKAGLLDDFKVRVGHERGSGPTVYVLTSDGAGRLTPSWSGGAAELQRLVKNVGARRRDVKDGKATNLTHALATASLFAMLVRHVRTVDPDAVVDAHHWDRGLSIPVDVGPSISVLKEPERLLLSPQVAAGKTTMVTYVPDVTFRLCWTPPGYRERITEVLVVEVETGLGGKAYEEAGAMKGAKLAALLTAVDASRTVGPITLPNPRLVKVFFVCGTAHVEDGIRAGLRRVFGPDRRSIVTTNETLLPLVVPTGTAKKDLPTALAALAATIGGPTWKWYGEADDAPRFGYPKMPRASR